MSLNFDILPDSRLGGINHAKGAQLRGEIWWVPVYCANCGRLEGMVPEENITHAFFLCDEKCAPMWANLAGTYTTPDEVFYREVQEFQMNKYGRILSLEEMVLQLDDVNSALSRLARERQQLTPKSS